MTLKFQKKQLIILLAILAVIGIAGIAVLFSVLSPNNFRNNITQAVHKALGRELFIEGNISVSVFPWIGIKVNQIALANPEGFGKEPMIRIQEADISVKLLSLLRSYGFNTPPLEALKMGFSFERYPAACSGVVHFTKNLKPKFLC